MPVSTDTRPPGVNQAFRPGNAAELTIVFPSGSLTGRTFSSSLNGTTLSSGNGSLTVLGDTMTIVASATLTATLGTGSFPWLLTETTGGGTEKLLIGTWTGSNRPNVTGTQTIDVLDGDVTLNVTGGPAAFSPDLVMQAPAYPGDGTVNGGVIRRTQSMQVPWSYTQEDWVPSDSAVGTAVYVDWQSTIGTGTGLLGPTSQTGYYGPRGVFQLEGLVRYATNMTAFGFAPVGYGDFINIANDAGNARDLAPSWGFLAARSVLADGATCELVGTDVNDGGAAFVDSAYYGTVRTGHLDGTTNDIEVVSFLAMPGLGGDTDMLRVVGFDVQGAHLGWHPTLPNPTDHWAAAGLTMDANSVTLEEEIGLRIQPFTVGTTKIGILSAHVIKSLTNPITNTGTSSVVGATVGLDSTGTAVTFTLQDAAGGFRTGNVFTGYQVAPTLVFEEDGGVLGSVTAYQASPTVKNASGEARTVPFGQPFASRITYRGDAAALTVTSHIAFDDTLVTDVVSAGTVAVTTATGMQSSASISAGGTVTTRKGFNFADGSGAGSIGTQIGIDIAALAKGGTANIGIRNASTEVATPSVQTLTAVGNTITPNAKVKRLNNTSAGSLTLTSNPHISDGQDGQILILFNSSANDVVLTDGNGVQLGAASRTIGTRDSLMLIYSTDLGDWIELAFTNN